MSELTAPTLVPEITGGESAFQKKLVRVKRTASLIGLVGIRQAIPLLTERIVNANSREEHQLRIRELEHPFLLTGAHSDIAMTNEIIGMGVYDLGGHEESIDGNLILD